MSSIRLHLGDMDAAETFLEGAIRFSPGRVGPYVNLAAIKLRRGEPGEAIRILDQVGQLGDVAAVHFSRGEVFFAQGRLDQVRLEYRRAVELDPGSKDLRYRVASRMREMESSSPGRPLVR